MSKKAKTTEKPVATVKKAPVKKARAKKTTVVAEEPKSQEPVVAEPAVAVLPIKGEPEPKPASKKMVGLRKPQIRSLEALAKADRPLVRAIKLLCSKNRQVLDVTG